MQRQRGGGGGALPLPPSSPPPPPPPPRQELGWWKVVLVLVLVQGVERAGGQGLELDLLADGPLQPTDRFGLPVLNLEPAEYWFDGGIVAAPELNVMGGFVEDSVELQMFSATQDAFIVYSIGKDAESTPEPVISFRGSVGSVWDGEAIELTKNFMVKAFAGHLLALDSPVISTDQIYVRVRPPSISVLPGPEAGSMRVVINASTSNPEGEPSISYTLDGTDPASSLDVSTLEGQGIGQVEFVVYRSLVVKAIAFQAGMAPSLVSSSGVIQVPLTPRPLLLGWQGSMGWWHLGREEFYFGNFSRGRRHWGGVCNEQFDTFVSPAKVLDMEGVTGSLSLLGPACKGGVWDVDPEGVSACEFHPLLFQGSVGYVGREEDPVRGSPLCNISGQPNLASFREYHRTQWALRFDGMLNRGLYVTEDIREHLLAGKLPESEFTVEVQMTIAPAALLKTRLHGLVAVQQDSTGVSQARYHKGWALLYTTNAAQKTVTLSLSVSVEGNNDANNHGRFQVLSVALPSSGFESEAWTHVAALYDLKMMKLFVNGTLRAEVQACAAPHPVTGCGKLVYPSHTDPRSPGATPFIIGGYDNVQTGISVSHQGLMGGVRIFSKRLEEEEVKASSSILLDALPASQCHPGAFGPYQGIQPCLPCPLGTYSPSPAMDACLPCPRGFYADEEGLRACKSCPFAVTTPQTTEFEGSVSPEECGEPSECEAWSGLSNNCNVHATCVKTVGSFECHCNQGFTGTGVECSPLCGDGIRVLGEECDDGNQFRLDGCTEACKIEDGWSCDPRDPTVLNSTSECTCHLEVELCCHRHWVSCMREDGRFGGEGLDGSGLDLPLQEEEQVILASSGQSCSTACSLLGPEMSCVRQTSVQREAQGLQLAGEICVRQATYQSKEGVAELLEDPAPLPMVDEFGVNGEGSLDRASSSPKTCYVWPSDGPAASNECDALPRLATGRRVCNCQKSANFCSRDCLSEQATCLAKDPNLQSRRQAAASEYLPCLDNPEFKGFWSEEAGELTCAQVAAFQVTDCPANFNNCSACPASCPGACDVCYKEGGRYYYGETEVPHPEALGHPSRYQTSHDPWALEGLKDANSCKFGYAYCTMNGYQACSAAGICPLSSADAISLAPGAGEEEGWEAEVASCQCLDWLRLCLLAKTPSPSS